MKKVYGIIIAVVLMLIAGCTPVAKGDYKEGTYFGYDETNRHTAVIYVDESGMIKSVFVDAAYLAGAEGAKYATTKQMLGDGYGMKSASKIGSEWYEQIAKLTDKVIEEQGLDWLEFKYRVTTEDGDFEFTSDKPENQAEGDNKYTDSVAGVTIHVNESYTAIKSALDKAKK